MTPCFTILTLFKSSYVMKVLDIKSSASFDDKMRSYPDHIRDKMFYLRSLVHQTAQESGITAIEESLKWGEPSFITEKGSTLRMDWKPKSPEQYAMYFSCSTRLVETFRMVFSEAFTFEGKRAIIFDLNSPVPEDELKRCISATLRYHEVKKDIKLDL